MDEIISNANTPANRGRGQQLPEAKANAGR
jgi:hypothetical protein